MTRKRLLGTRWGPASIAAALAAILAVLGVKSNTHEFDFNTASLVIRDLKQVDAQWNVDVLSVDAGLHNDFDKVVASLPDIRRLSGQLRGLTASYELLHAESGKDLARLLDAYVTAMDEKIHRVERVKSSYAILANSSRYLPTANALLLAAAREARLPAAEMAALQSGTNGILSAAVSDLMSPDPVARADLEAAANEVRAQLPRLPRGIAGEAEGLLAHVDVIVKQREANKLFLAAVGALPTGAALDALNDRYLKELERERSVQGGYRRALIAYALGLLVLLGYAGWSLFRHYRSLNESNVQLKASASEAQLLLIQSAKMSAIGQMVAGIAHEINSPLAYVKATFSVLRELLAAAQENASGSAFGQRLSEPARNREVVVELESESAVTKDLIEDINSLLDDGLHGIEQISELILTLKNFSRIDRAKRSDVALSEGLNSALTIARYMLKRAVDVKREYQDVPKVHCSPSQINQVFLNIITNAAQAMSGRSEKGRIVLRTARHGDDMVKVEIQDNGCGIAPDVLPHIFEPFFTTKDPGEGTGSGLAICRRIVENHGGRITVASQPGAGTTFSIFLPIDGRQAPQPSPPRELAAAA